MSSHALVAPRWAQQLEDAGLADPRFLLTHDPNNGSLQGDWQPLTKPGLGGRRRWRWNLNDAADSVIFVKQYRRTPLKEQWDRMCRQSAGHSRAYWEYLLSERLAAAHINVPAAVGYAEQMVGGFERSSAVLLARAPGDAFDRTWMRLCDASSLLTRGLARHDMTRRLARFVAALHGTGYFHRDLYLCHIFVELDEAAGQPPIFTLIDLARMHRPRWRRTRWLVKDLAQLDFSARQVGASRADRWRFLLAYLNLLRGAPRARWYARRILRKSNWMMRRDLRKRAKQ